MRDWLKDVGDELDLDCIYRYEYLLGRKLNGWDEYVEIDRQVDDMILDYTSRREFFKDYPDLKQYRKVSVRWVA